MTRRMTLATWAALILGCLPVIAHEGHDHDGF